MLAIAAAMISMLGQTDVHSKVDLVSARSVITPGESFDVALRFQMDPGWHIYWKNPGESGLSPKIDWHLPKGWTAGPIEWPAPERIENGGVVNYTYEKEVLLLTKITAPPTSKPGAVKLAGTVSWLCCREACVPGKAELALGVTVGGQAGENRLWSRPLRTARLALPKAIPTVTASATGAGSEIKLLVRTAVSTDTYAKPEFFCSDDAIEPSAVQVVKPLDNGFEVTLKLSPYVSKAPVRLRGLLVASKGAEWAPGRSVVPVDIPIQRSTQ